MCTHQVSKKSDESKDSFYGELRAGVQSLPEISYENVTRRLNAKVGRENIFKPTNGQESLHQDSNDNGVRLTNFATSKNLVVKSMVFPHRNIHK